MSELILSFKRNGTAGAGVLTAMLGGRPIHVADCRIVDPGERERAAADLCAIGRGIDGAAVRAKLLELAAGEAMPRPAKVKPAPPMPSIEPYAPFPLMAMPEPSRTFIESGAASIGCDPSYLALPLLSLLGAAVGNSRRIRLRPDWLEPATIWTAVVAPSGSAKSPGAQLVLRPMLKRQGKIMREHATAVAKHKAALREWKRQPPAARGDEPEPPAGPEHLYSSDATVEGISVRLAESPRGLMLAFDELSALFGGLGQYKKGGGNDREAFLSFYDAAPVKIDRKAAVPPTIWIPRAFVAITGGIQPGILRRTMTGDQFDSGMAARFLYAMPPVPAVAWSERTVDAGAAAALGDVLDALLGLRMTEGDDGLEPVALPLSEAAQAAFVAFYNRHGAEQGAMDDDRLRAAWAKQRGAAARLALVLHCTAAAAGASGIDATTVDETSIGAGIALADWFGRETRRVYGVLAEEDEDRERRELLDLLASAGGRMTARELRQRRRVYRDDQNAAEAALDALADAGAGRWEYSAPGLTGGRPSKTFVLDASRQRYPDSEAVAGGFGSVDSAEGNEIVAGDDGRPLLKPEPQPSAGPAAGNRDKSLSVNIPQELQTDAFRCAWAAWQQHRREIRKKITPLAAQCQLAELAQMGEARAVAAIKYSIKNGWTGLFEDKTHGNANQQHRAGKTGQFDEDLTL